MRDRGLICKLHRRYAATALLAIAGSLVVSSGFGSLGLASAGADPVSPKLASDAVSSTAASYYLPGVSADSSSDAWAVGYYGPSDDTSSDTLALHWNGSKWASVSSPNPLPGDYNQLEGVSALSAKDAWAVGDDYSSSKPAATLVLHWNGTKWAQVTSPNVGTEGDSLKAVSADSAGDAWAVGNTLSSTGSVDTLILHWNGKAWSHVSSPTPANSGLSLSGVTAISSSAAWAVGYYYNDTTNTYDSLTLRWNGSKWSEVSSPNPDATGEDRLNAVSADGPDDVWAVGTLCPTVSARCAFSDESTFVLHWNGKAWAKVSSPSPSTTANFLEGVSADRASAKDAWAVGWYATKSGADDTLTLHWNGAKWSQVTAPNPGAQTNFLEAVAAVSKSDALAVGQYSISGGFDYLGLHWNGAKWVQA